MCEARLDAEHFARLLRGVGADVAVFAMGTALDYPEVAHGNTFVTAQFRAEALRHQLRRKPAFVVFEIAPSLHRLDHMSVGVNGSHQLSP